MVKLHQNHVVSLKFQKFIIFDNKISGKSLKKLMELHKEETIISKFKKYLLTN